MKTGRLFLIPTPLDTESGFGWDLMIQGIVKQLRFFIAEEIRTTRRHLRKAIPDHPIDECTFFLLNEHTTPQEVNELISPLKKGYDMGLMSEAGMPAIADPGALLVRLCHQENIEVIPLPGPTSPMMALAASGFNGQHFRFHGYLPVKQPDRSKKIKELERATLSGETQIFIETPYRNLQLLEDILKICNADTPLCIAAGLTGPGQFIKTAQLKYWKSAVPPIHKKPAVFLLGPYGCPL
ncbi:MAG: SAM-dependent methyltransferase [Bacteroidales bacterium]